MARPADSAQFDGNCAVAIGRASVCPSTRITQGMSGGICRSQVEEGRGDAVELGRASGRSTAWPAGNSTSDWKTKRSPTMRMSWRLPRIWRRRPKKSER